MGGGARGGGGPAPPNPPLRHPPARLVWEGGIVGWGGCWGEGGALKQPGSVSQVRAAAGGEARRDPPTRGAGPGAGGDGRPRGGPERPRICIRRGRQAGNGASGAGRARWAPPPPRSPLGVCKGLGLSPPSRTPTVTRGADATPPPSPLPRPQPGAKGPAWGMGGPWGSPPRPGATQQGARRGPGYEHAIYQPPPPGFRTPPVGLRPIRSGGWGRSRGAGLTAPARPALAPPFPGGGDG